MVYKMKCKKLSHFCQKIFFDVYLLNLDKCPLGLKYSNVTESYLKTNTITIDIFTNILQNNGL